MRKLVNDPYRAVDEMLEGLLVAHPGAVKATATGRGIVYTGKRAERRTGVIVGGGSGHEPAFFGYLGPGLADAAAVGNVFASPAANPAVEAAREVAGDDGVVFLYGNYEGDIMNFDMAGDLLADEGIVAESVLVTDDVVSAPAARATERRGVAGDVIAFKVAGARADEGASRAEVVAATRHANERTRSVGVGLGPCTVPTAGRPTFDLPDGEMDIGMGVHGEAGIRRDKLRPADEVTDELLDLILADLPPREGEPLLVLVNTLGATPTMEALIVLRRVASRLADEGIRMHRALVGEYVTSLEMTGLSLTVTHVDAELERLLDAPCRPLMAPALAPRPA
ncbi:MAG: dihydroxyacetone kinase subunit DhaK [Actinobacteria bacterium]|nr:dihydroxyacetone kinase subunit DhaK [Actinomycetota bacterium]